MCSKRKKHHKVRKKLMKITSSAFEPLRSCQFPGLYWLPGEYAKQYPSQLRWESPLWFRKRIVMEISVCEWKMMAFWAHFGRADDSKRYGLDDMLGSRNKESRQKRDQGKQHSLPARTRKRKQKWMWEIGIQVRVESVPIRQKRERRY